MVAGSRYSPSAGVVPLPLTDDDSMQYSSGLHVVAPHGTPAAGLGADDADADAEGAAAASGAADAFAVAFGAESTPASFAAAASSGRCAGFVHAKQKRTMGSARIVTWFYAIFRSG